MLRAVWSCWPSHAALASHHLVPQRDLGNGAPHCHPDHPTQMILASGGELWPPPGGREDGGAAPGGHSGVVDLHACTCMLRSAGHSLPFECVAMPNHLLQVGYTGAETGSATYRSVCAGDGAWPRSLRPSAPANGYWSPCCLERPSPSALRLCPQDKKSSPSLAPPPRRCRQHGGAEAVV